MDRIRRATWLLFDDDRLLSAGFFSPPSIVDWMEADIVLYPGIFASADSYPGVLTSVDSYPGVLGQPILNP